MPRAYTRTRERERRQVRALLAASRQWDEATMKISPEGEVTALKDPTKTMRAEAPIRYLVGHVADMLGPRT